MTQEVTIPSPIDRVEAQLLAHGGEAREKGGDNEMAPVRHLFTPGLYSREIFMPAGAVITSAIHKTEHPYVVSQGMCLVYMENEGRWERITAPHRGVTKPMTRRLLIIIRDTVWTTFHPTENEKVEEIEDEILYHRKNPLLDYSQGTPQLKEDFA